MVIRLRFDEETAAERIDRIRHARFLRDDLLRAQGDGHGMFGGQRQRFVHGVGVQALRSAEDGRQRLDRHADHIILRLLCGERYAGGLRVEAQQPRARILSP